MKFIMITFLYLGLSFGSLSSLYAQKDLNVVEIGGVVQKPFSVSLADLQGMKRISISRKDKDDNEHEYSGVLLTTLLKQAGATLDNELRGENLTKFVLAEAIDGYQVIFSLAELDGDFSAGKIILADAIDSEPFLEADGPFRIIVENDKKPARCIKQLKSIKVGFAK